MIQFDENGKGRPLPEPDGTVDLAKRASELRFLKAIRSAVVVPLGDASFLIKATRFKSETELDSVGDPPEKPA